MAIIKKTMDPMKAGETFQIMSEFISAHEMGTMQITGKRKGNGKEDTLIIRPPKVKVFLAKKAKKASA